MLHDGSCSVRDMTMTPDESSNRVRMRSEPCDANLRLAYFSPSFRSFVLRTYELGLCTCTLARNPIGQSGHCGHCSLLFFALPTPSTSMPRFWSSPQTVDAFRLSIISVVFTATAGIGGCVAFGVSDGAHYESVGYLGCVMCWLVGTRHNKCSADPQAVFPCLFILS